MFASRITHKKAKTLFLKTKCFMNFYVWLGKWFIFHFAWISTEININQSQGSSEQIMVLWWMITTFSLRWISLLQKLLFPFFSCICLVWKALIMSFLEHPLYYIWFPNSAIVQFTLLVSCRARPKILDHFQIQYLFYCITLWNSYVDHCEYLINAWFLTAVYLLLIAD